MPSISEKRKTYDQILQHVLDLYFLGCKMEYKRKKGSGSLVANIDQILSGLDEDIAHEFKHAIERLMWHCFNMVLGLGLNKKAHEYDREKALEILNQYGIDNIRKHLSADEILELDDDLRTMGILE